MQLISILKLLSRSCYLEKLLAAGKGPAPRAGGGGESQIQCHWVFMNQRDEIDARELALSSKNLQPDQ